jgi:hypothetical protein
MEANQTLVNLITYACDQHPEIKQFILTQHRQMLSDKIKTLHNNTVGYGLFKGLKFVNDSHWGASDMGGMILGLYEQEILRELSNIPKRFKTFIDLGAADGYYGIGVLVNNTFDKSYCYEITEAGKKVISENARINNVTEKVLIRGKATKNLASEIPNSDLNNSVLFVDIEGAEFDLFDQTLFKSFSNSIIFIELHDFLYSDGEKKLNTLNSNSKKTHSAKFIKMGIRDLSFFPELKQWNDLDRWMLCSEGRAQLMTWVRFDPIE